MLAARPQADGTWREIKFWAEMKGKVGNWKGSLDVGLHEAGGQARQARLHPSGWLSVVTRTYEAVKVVLLSVLWLRHCSRTDRIITEVLVWRPSGIKVGPATQPIPPPAERCGQAYTVGLVLTFGPWPETPMAAISMAKSDCQI